MISTLHTADVIDTTSRRTGVAKKKPKCVIDYNTHMHGVDTVDQYLAYNPFIRKIVKWRKKVFFYLLQCCLFNSYDTFSKNNPNSCKSFLDFMSDITENLIHQMLYHHRHHHLASRNAPVEHLHLLQKKCPKSDPSGRLDGKLKNHKLVLIPPTKNDKTPTQKCRPCVRKNIK